MTRSARPSPLLALAALAAAAAPLPAAAEGQLRCGERERIVAHLERKYGETRRSIGLQQDSRLVEVFANAESGSWTILITTPHGVSCLIAAGSAYQGLAPVAVGEPA